MKPRVDALTGIRFLAAFVVVLAHTGIPGAPHVLDTFAAAGYTGVTVFFVLSGFVLGLNYFDSFRRWTRSTPRVAWNFAVARFARIYPLYVTVLLVVWIARYGESDHGFPLHVFALQAWSSDLWTVASFNGPGWSVGVEFFLYACFPFIALLLGRYASRPRALLNLAAIIASTLFLLAGFFWLAGGTDLVWEDPRSAHRWLFFIPATRIGDFTLGVIAALLFLQATQTWRDRGRWLALVGGVGILGLMAWELNLVSVLSWDAAYAPLCFLLILGLALSPDALCARLLARRPMLLPGESSYALYLIHLPMSWWLYRPLTDQVGAPRFLSWVLFLLVLVLSSIAIHLAFERPLRRRIRSALSVPVTPAPTPASVAA